MWMTGRMKYSHSLWRSRLVEDYTLYLFGVCSVLGTLTSLGLRSGMLAWSERPLHSSTLIWTAVALVTRLATICRARR